VHTQCSILDTVGKKAGICRMSASPAEPEADVLSTITDIILLQEQLWWALGDLGAELSMLRAKLGPAEFGEWLTAHNGCGPFGLLYPPTAELLVRKYDSRELVEVRLNLLSPPSISEIET
jgi:hypothetical protein